MNDKSSKNIESLLNLIEEIYACGGTRLDAGMNTGL